MSIHQLILAKILTIIPYQFYPPENGGSMRCFYLLREMARLHTVYLFTIQQEKDFFQSGESAFPKNITVISLYDAKPYHSIFNILPGKLADGINFRMLKKSLGTPSNSYFLKAFPLLLQTLKEIQPGIVYYENLEAVSFFSTLVKKHLPSAKQIYDAHNVDAELWTQLAVAQNKPEFKKYAIRALAMEKQLYKLVDGVFCCSQKDKEKLVQVNSKKLEAWVVPNGVDTAAKIFDNNRAKHAGTEILFCGSLEYYPNEEGLLWFYYNVFPLIKNTIPTAVLTLVGTDRIKDGYRQILNDPSVNFEGRVADVKSFYYRATICIAPLLSGSGTRLKILEAMSFGNPVVATTIGAEGIEAVEEEHLLIADEPHLFAKAVIGLLSDQELYNKIRYSGFLLVKEKYDWEKTGLLINDILSN